MSRTKKIVFTALLIACGVILPMFLHSVPQGGNIFLPMHLPVLLCGLLCGPFFGVICGLLTPLISSLFFTMPPVAILPSMMFELAVYGLVIGLFKTKGKLSNIYFALISSMVLGRIVYGLVNALIFNVGKYTFQMWISASFIKAIPGIIIQLVLIPIIVLLLKKANFLKYDE